MKLMQSLALLALAVIATDPSARAQTARSGGAPNAQLMQQMQQLASERTTLQAENAKLKKELDDVRKERDQLKKGGEASSGRVRASEAALARSVTQREAVEKELEQTKARTQELIGKFRETIQALRDVEGQFTTTKATLTTREQELKACVDRNAALYELNSEVLTRLEKQGLWSRVARAEPFTQIKRAQLENLIDDYRARAQDQRDPGVSKEVPAAATAPQVPPTGTR